MPVDLRTGTIGKPISKVSNCQSIAIGGNGQTLYVAGCGGSVRKFKTILPVNVRTGTAGTPIAVPGSPIGVYVSPDGRIAYAVTNGDATLSPVDLATGTLGKVITVPDGVGDLAISPEGHMAYATGTTDKATGGGKQYAFVTPIDLSTGVAETPIALLHDPYGIVLSPGGRTAYVTGGNSPRQRRTSHTTGRNLNQSRGRAGRNDVLHPRWSGRHFRQRFARWGLAGTIPRKEVASQCRGA